VRVVQKGPGKGIVNWKCSIRRRRARNPVNDEFDSFNCGTVRGHDGKSASEGREEEINCLREDVMRKRCGVVCGRDLISAVAEIRLLTDRDREMR
jgi:hypothetical protein